MRRPVAALADPGTSLLEKAGTASTVPAMMIVAVTLCHDAFFLKEVTNLKLDPWSFRIYRSITTPNSSQTSFATDPNVQAGGDSPERATTARHKRDYVSHHRENFTPD